MKADNRMLRSILLAWALSQVFTAVAHPESRPQCSSYQQCNDAGTKALRAGNVDQAIALFELQAGYAELADIKLGHVDMGKGKEPAYSLGIIAYNNLAVAQMQKGDYLMARLWCRQALDWDK